MKSILDLDIPIINLIRYRSSIYGTFGYFIYEDIFRCHSLELPWYNNQHDISCIPPGLYYCQIFHGRKYKHVYQVTNVPNRRSILIHNGSYGGDRTKGLKSHTYGCILIGFKCAKSFIYQSRIALREFLEVMNDQPFILNIQDLVHDITPINTLEHILGGSE